MEDGQQYKYMKTMNILVVYSRDIDINDSGGARTTIQLINYLISIKGYNCYTTFKIRTGAVDKINYLSVDSYNVETLKKVIQEKGIDIFFAPEALVFANIAHKAVTNSNCKVVTALHSMPGYERIRLLPLLLESLRTNTSYLKRFRALLLIVFYPLFYMGYVTKQRYKFRQAYKNSDCLVLLSKYYFSDFQRFYKTPDTSKLIAIENGLSFSTYANKQDIEAKKKILLYVGRLEERSKRISLIIKAWSLLENEFPDWKLKIIGSGRSKKTYLSLIKRLKVKSITLYDNQPPFSFYKESSIFLMSSAFEGWPMTISEAKQLGCVPIAMNTYSSLKDLISSGKDGIIVENNINAFSDSIRWLINHEKERKMMALEAVENSKKYEPNIIYEKYAQLFEKLTYEV